MPPALPSHTRPDNEPPPESANPAGTSSLCSTKENEPSTTDNLDAQTYLELWQEVLANNPEPPFEGNEPFVPSGVVTKDDSLSTLRNHLTNIKMPEVKGKSDTLFSYLQAAIDEQSWPFIPYIRQTHLVQCEKFPHQPDTLIGCTIKSYALNQRAGTLKLLTLRGIVTITTLGIGNIGIDPNVQHALNGLGNGGYPRRTVLEASFARRKGNGSNASQFLVFGLRFGSMAIMGFIFCKDPEKPSSGPTGHVTLRYSSNMTDDALISRESSDKSKESESFKGSANSDFVQGPATTNSACCPYCFTDYTRFNPLENHLQKTLIYPSDSDIKHPVEEISDFLRNSRKNNSKSSPVHSAEATKPGSRETNDKLVEL